MPKYLFIMAFLTGTLLAQSQSFSFYSDTLRYRISAKQAKAFFDNNMVDFEGQVPIDTLRKGADFTRNSLAPGYYLDVFSLGRNVWQSVLPISNINWYMVDHQGVTVLKVADAGTEQTALYKKGKTSIPFDPALGGWKIRNGKRGKPHLLCVGTDSVWIYANGNVVKGEKRFLWNPMEANVSSFGRSSRQVKYMVSNQPMYRRGDTVRLKAYLSKKNGKAYNKPLWLEVRPPYPAKPILKDTLEPTRPGAWVYSFVLGDSLKLDQRYFVNLRNKRQYVSTYFQLEDYVLEDASYTATVFADSLYHGKAPYIEVVAKAANGLPIMDGSVRIKMNLEEVYKDDLEAYSNLFPLSLYTDTLALHRSGTTRVQLPDSVLQYLGSKYKASLEFIDGSGNIEREESYVELRLPRPIFHHRWLAARLYIDSVSYPVNWEGARTQSIMVTTEEAREKVGVKYHELPTVLPFNQHAISHELKIAGHTEKVPVLIAPVSGDFTQRKDSFFFELKNPVGLDVAWEIWQKDRVIQHGTSRESTDIPVAEGAVLAKWNYYWAGGAKSGRADFAFFPNSLILNIEQAEEASPGDILEVTLRLNDLKGNPVPNADITAWALHSRFGTGGAPTLDGVDEQVLKFRSALPYGRNITARKDRLHLEEDWAKPLGIYGNDFWSFYYPDSITYVYQDMHAPDSNLAAIAVFPFQNGYQKGVQMLYLDNNLVYSSKAQDNRYAIATRAGSYNLKIRTINKTYIINDVVLKKGKKLDLSFNHTDWPGGDAIHKARQKVTRREARLLNQKILAGSVLWNEPGMNAYISDGIQVWEVDSRYNRQPDKVGVFKQGLRLTFGDRGLYSFSERFDPGFVHGFRKNLLKLTPLPMVKKGAHWSWGNRTPGEMPVWLQDYLKRPLAKPSPRSFDVNPGAFEKGTKSQQVEIVGKDVQVKGPLYLFSDHRVWPLWNYSRRFALPVGIHRAAIQNMEGEYALFDLVVKEGYQTWIMADELVFGDKSLDEFFEETRLHYQVDFAYGSATLSVELPPFDSGNLLLEIGYGQHVAAIIPIASERKYSFYHMPAGISSIALIDTSSDEVWTGEILLRKSKNHHVRFTSIKGGFLIRGETGDSSRTTIYLKSTLISPSRRKTIYKVQALEATTAGVQSIQNKKIRIRGSRSLSVGHYVDGELTQLEEVVVTGSSRRFKDRYKGRGAGNVIKDGEGDVDFLASKKRKNDKGSLWWINPMAEEYKAAAETREIKARLMDDVDGDGIPDLYDKDTPSGLLKNTFRIRADWRDYAYWQPLLLTNEQGEARFRAVMPGQLTRWNSYAVAAAPDGRTALVRGYIRSIQQLAGKLDVPRFLLAGDSLLIRGRALNYTDSVMQVQSAFLIGEEEVYSNSDSLHDVRKDEYAMRAGKDSLEVTYTVQLSSGYGDGERREIPVLPVGMERSIGEMAYLEGDTVHRFSIQKADSTFELLIADSPLEMLLTQLDHLKSYPHACNEQTASKLRALLLKQQVLDSLGRRFSEKSLINRLANKLKKNQNDDGGWGWWPGGDSHVWISLHVAEVLGSYDAEHSALKRANSFLIKRYDKLNTAGKLRLLQYFVETGADVATESLLNEIPTPLYRDGWTSMLYAKLNKSLGKPWKSDSLFAHIDSMQEYGYGWSWFGAPVDRQLLAYELNRERDTAKTSLPKRKLMLEELAAYRYNTFHTAKVLAALIPDFLKHLPKNSNQSAQVQLLGWEEPIEQFPFRSTLSVPDQGELLIRKTGLNPLTVTVAQKYWEPNPERTDSIFEISTSWFQNGEKVEQIEEGTVLTYKVEVLVKEAATEVALVIPIPANCYWKEKPSARGQEAHREYEKDRLNIYLNRMARGRYSFELKLEPRFRGRFTVNPVQCFPMYEPLRSGNTTIKLINCEK